eukprot:5282408-Pyramimonas_sp.AAC.1
MLYSDRVGEIPRETAVGEIPRGRLPPLPPESACGATERAFRQRFVEGRRGRDRTLLPLGRAN